MQPDDSSGLGCDFDDLPLELFGPALASWMNGIDAAFVKADDENKVWGQLAAMTQVMRMLRSLPGFDCKLVALRDLHERLERLSEGQKKPMLELVEAVRMTGRPGESYYDHKLQVTAVALVAFAIEKGWQPSKAHEKVATELARIKVRGRRGQPVKAATVKRWETEKIRLPDPLYSEIMDTLKAHAPDAMSERDIKKLIRNVIERGQSALSLTPRLVEE